MDEYLTDTNDKPIGRKEKSFESNEYGVFVINPAATNADYYNAVFAIAEPYILNKQATLKKLQILVFWLSSLSFPSAGVMLLVFAIYKIVDVDVKVYTITGAIYLAFICTIIIAIIIAAVVSGRQTYLLEKEINSDFEKIDRIDNLKPVFEVHEPSKRKLSFIITFYRLFLFQDVFAQEDAMEQGESNLLDDKLPI